MAQFRVQGNPNLPQIESLFPIIFPNLARSQFLWGMTSAALMHHPAFESGESHISNALKARALPKFPYVSNLSNNPPAERIFLEE
jgi:hypothetical protein